MRKTKKIWIKQEKRIVQLLYKKGLIDLPLNELYWNEYKTSNRYISGKYRFSNYLPEIHFCTTDYWGESDEHSLVDSILDSWYWEHSYTDETQQEGDYPLSNFKYRGRRWLIKHLKEFKSVNSDNKINRLLKRNMQC